MTIASQRKYDLNGATNYATDGYTSVAATKYYDAGADGDNAHGYYNNAADPAGSFERAGGGTLLRDGHYSNSAAWFLVAAKPNTVYQIDITFGDYSYNRPSHYFVVDSSPTNTTSVNDETTSGVWKTVSVLATDTAGNGYIRCIIQESQSDYWTACAIVVTELTTTVTCDPPPILRKWDCGTAASPTAAGYTALLITDLWDEDVGYGWIVPPEASVDRTSGGDLNRDIHYSRHKGASFAFSAVPDAVYKCSITFGDYSGARADQIAYAENSTYTNTGLIDTAANTFTTTAILAKDADGDGRIHIFIENRDLANEYWTLTAIQVEQQSFPVPLGVLTLEEQIPSVVIPSPVNVSAPLGELELTKYDPVTAISDNKLYSPATAELTLTEQTPTVEATTGNDIDVAVPLGELELTSQTPTTVATANQWYSPATGELNLSDETPTTAVSDNKLYSPATGELNLSDETPTTAVSDNKLYYPDKVELTLEDQTPVTVATANQWYAPDTAELNLSDETPTTVATANQWYSPATVELTLEEQTPATAVSDNKLYSPDTAQLTLTDQTPVLSISDNKVYSPATAELTLADQTPTTVATDNQWYSPDIAQLTLAEQTPVVAKIINVPVGELKLCRSAYDSAFGSAYGWCHPEILITATIIIAVPVGELTLTQYDPTTAISDNKVYSPDTAELTLTEQTPTVVKTANVIINVPLKTATLTNGWQSYVANEITIPESNGIYTRLRGDNTNWFNVTNGYFSNNNATYSLTITPQAGDWWVQRVQQNPTRYYSWILPNSATPVGTYIPNLIGGTGPTGNVIVTDGGLIGPIIKISDHKRIAVPVGQLTLTKQTPTTITTANQWYEPDTVQLTLTEQTPTTVFTDNQWYSPATAQLTLTGLDPTVVQTTNYIGIPDTAQLDLIEQSVAIVVGNNKVALPQTAELTLTDLEPTVAVSDHKVAQPDTAQLNLVDQTPSVVITSHVLVGVPVGGLRLNGQVPGWNASSNVVVIVDGNQLHLTSNNPTYTNYRWKDSTTICADLVRDYFTAIDYETSTIRIYPLTSIKGQKVKVFPRRRKPTIANRCKDLIKSHLVEISVQKQGLETLDETFEDLQQLLVGQKFGAYLCTGITTEDLTQKERLKQNTYLGKFTAEFISSGL